MALPYPSKTFTNGQTPTTAQWNELNANDQALAAGTGLNTGAVPAAALSTSAICLGYAQITASFSTTNSAATQVTGLSAAVTIPAGGRRIKITAFVSDIYGSAGAYMAVGIWDGAVGTGTQIGRSQSQVGASMQSPITAMAVVTPSAGAKTYNVSLATSTGSATLEAGSTYPAFILVEAI